MQRGNELTAPLSSRMNWSESPSGTFHPVVGVSLCGEGQRVEKRMADAALPMLQADFCQIVAGECVGNCDCLPSKPPQLDTKFSQDLGM